MYNPLKPDSGPSPSLDASIIQGNFSDYASIFATNHVALNNTSQGAHGTIIMENQIGDPGDDEGKAVLYNKNFDSNAGDQPNLFVQIPKFLPTNMDTTNAPNTGMVLTYNQVNTTGPVYQSFLAGGFLFYFGSISGTSVPNMKTVLPINLLPVPTKLLTAIANPNTLTTIGTPTPFSVSTNIISPSSFNIYSNANGAGPSIPYSFTWSAIAIA